MSYLVGDWEVVIFNDARDWGYVESVVSPDGRVADFDDLNPNDHIDDLTDDQLPCDWIPDELFKPIAEAFMIAGKKYS